MPTDVSLFSNTNPFVSGYGVIIRFRRTSYCGWIGIEQGFNGGIGAIRYSITTYDAFPTAWKDITTPT